MYLWIWNTTTDEVTSGYSHGGRACPAGCFFLLASNRDKALIERDRAKAQIAAHA